MNRVLKTRVNRDSAGRVTRRTRRKGLYLGPSLGCPSDPEEARRLVLPQQRLLALVCSYTQPYRFKVVVTATRGLRGVWPQRASVPMSPKVNLLGRGRNKVKFTKWGFYFKDCKKAQNSMKRLREAASIQKARVPIMKLQPLVLEKVSNNKVEVAWPLPVSADTCTRFLKLVLGARWRKFVTDLAGVQGAHQEAGTAEEEVVVKEEE